MENTDIRDVTLSVFPFVPDFIAADLSFISLEKIIPKVANLLKQDGQAIFLLKPQFECGSKALNKRGVVKNPITFKHVTDKIFLCLTQNKFKIKGYEKSPIKGKKGNTEFLILAEKI